MQSGMCLICKSTEESREKEKFFFSYKILLTAAQFNWRKKNLLKTCFMLYVHLIVGLLLCINFLIWQFFSLFSLQDMKRRKQKVIEHIWASEWNLIGMKLCALPYGFDHHSHQDEKTSGRGEVDQKKVADDDGRKRWFLEFAQWVV